METDALFDLPAHDVPWPQRRRVGFDVETTSADPLVARIVTAALVIHDDADPEHPQRTRDWLIDPGVEIPAQASDIHGITTEYAQTHGQQATEAIPQLVAVLGEEFALGSGVIIMNAPYDLTVLATEAKRYGADLPTPSNIIDPLVIDRQMDKYRRGKRTLSDLSQHYDVGLEDAHSAAADASAALGVAVALAEKYPQIHVPAAGLHQAQVQWKAEQAADLQAYFRRTRPDAYVDPSWPVDPQLL